MTDVLIGTCGLCGGPVTIPEVWAGSIPPVPSCAVCGAKKKMPYGPVVDMETVAAPDSEDDE